MFAAFRRNLAVLSLLFPLTALAAGPQAGGTPRRPQAPAAPEVTRPVVQTRQVVSPGREVPKTSKAEPMKHSHTGPMNPNPPEPPAPDSTNK